MNMLTRIGLWLDTRNGPRLKKAFRTGWPARSSSEIGFFETPMVQYRYRERGSGPTIVFTADPPVTLESYDALLDQFAPHFRVVIVELPAMGFSAVEPTYDFTFRNTNDDIAIFVKAICGEGAILAFSCAAGLAAVDIAVRQPELVSRLVLMQTGDVAAFARWKARRDPKGILARPIFGQYVMRKLAPKRMGDWFRLSVGNRDMIAPFCDCAEESFKHGALWSLASAYQVYMDAGIELGKPKQPILATWGLADRSHPPENAASPMNFSDNVRYISYPELGHFAELENPKKLFEAIFDFCQR